MSLPKNTNLNWQPSPFDARDFMSNRFRKFASTPMPYSLYPVYRAPIYNQLRIGSCTGNMGSSGLRYEAKEIGIDFSPSRLFQYYTNRLLIGMEEEDSGAYIRDVLKAMNKYGVCSEEIWPYEVDRFSEYPPDHVWEDALLQKVTQYARVPKTEEAIKRTIMSGAVVMFGFLIYESFDKGNWASTTGIMPDPSGAILGGHAVYTDGWEGNNFTVPNSWGKDWGLDGVFKMPMEFMLSDNCSDFWVIEKVEIKSPVTDNPILDFSRKIWQSKSHLSKLTEPRLVDVANAIGVVASVDDSKGKTLEKVWSKINQ